MKTILMASLLVSMTALAASKLTIDEAKAILSQYAQPGSQCEADVNALNSQSTCPSLRKALESCEVTAVDEHGEPTDVSNVVSCKEN